MKNVTFAHIASKQQHDVFSAFVAEESANAVLL